MLLAVNIGNTNTVAAIFRGRELGPVWRIATVPERMPDEYAALFHTLFAVKGVEYEGLSGVILGSVVPQAGEAFAEAALQYWKCDPVIVSHRLDLGISLAYTTPDRLGADRIANMVAAQAIVGQPAISVDLGTATNFDVLSADGMYLGGAIAPGLEIIATALIDRTAQLPSFPLLAPESFIGTDTVTSLQSGLLYGYASLVDGLVSGCRRQLGQEAATVATGGLAGRVVPHTTTIGRTVPNLTLAGLQILYERNRAKHRHQRAGEG